MTPTITIPPSQFARSSHLFFTEEEGGIFSSGLDIPFYVLYLLEAGEELNTVN